MAKNTSPKEVQPADENSAALLQDDSINDATLLVCLSDGDTRGAAGSGVSGKNLGATTMQVEGGSKYEVRRLVAKGGMGVVYEASDINCDRTVALKVLMTDEKHEKENKRRFVSEAQITSRLEHPNIVPIHELGKDLDGNVFYSMKYVRGVTLGDVLNDIRRGRAEVIEQYPLGRLLTIFQKTCDAVAFAHSNGVVHRDLKPGNVMIGKYGEVLVLDWGLARLIAPSARDTVAGDVDKDPAPEVVSAKPPKIELQGQIEERILDTIRVETAGTGLKTISGTVLGTPGFMAPEQVRKDGIIDSRTDIYELGAILYSILTLRAPIRERRNIPELLRMILEGNIMPPMEYGETEEGWNLRHCPDGRIPRVLSDITMKAMAVNQADRYPSVKELQQEIEDYQNGLVWHVVIDEDFTSVDALQHWEPMGCQCEIADGELRMYGGELQMLLLKRDLPGDVRIEFECHQEGTYMNDVACLMSGFRAIANAWETSISGYAFKYGAYTNTMNVLTKFDRRIWSEPAAPLAPGRRYKVRAERVGNRLRMWVNGKEIFTVTDPEPLTGSNRTVVGLLGWIADTRFSRVTIYSLGTPWKSDILDIAERHLQKGHYATSMDLFQEVIQSFPDAQRLERALKGFETARARDNMEKKLPVWQEKLAEAWPGLALTLKIENEGLSLEIPNVGIADLSPLKDIPLTSLACWGNRITTLDPLRGMPLNALNCAANPISNLEPLRGLPLSILRCEACGLETLEPLRGAPLTVVNCSENKLGGDGLEPLKGMRLTWLACMHTGVKNLSPLEGMPLTWFFCDGNQIEDLEPLRELPLTELSCRGNRIVNLDPLKGGKLNTLRVDDNLIASLEPLRGLPLTTFSCCWNRVTTLEPLRGMPVSCLLCGGNHLGDIGSFIKNPTKVFFFDCDTIPTKELEWIHQTWSRDLRFSSYVKNIDVLLALREVDAKQLRELASQFQGRRYLFVPKFVTWPEAKRICESLGGHLVTITSEEENEFVASLFPLGGSWFWIGLVVGKGKQQWITGEPLEFRAFVNVLQEHTPGPRVFSGRNWCFDVAPDSHNCFMIEWDS
jgi:serine/threonine protein kinase/Leucine-rich repeat (LRR) protein